MSMHDRFEYFFLNLEITLEIYKNLFWEHDDFLLDLC